MDVEGESGMARSTVVAARATLAGVLACCVLSQVLVIPWLAAEAAGRFPEAEHLRQPVTVLAVSVVAAVEAALMLAWPLLRMLQPGAVVRRRFLACADVLIGALLAAAVLLGAILDVLSRAQMCPPAVALGLLAGMAACLVPTIVVIIWRVRMTQELRSSPRSRPATAD